mmetsp:Transcript_35318/g.88308  ORF Transcript_35318/g.88308 Transcript_35318/m.88308 type:complete len:88 (-) Transcript_35318:810-1073(-)
MTITVETHASIGHARRRDDAGNDHDRVPEHLKCVVCLEAPAGRIEQCTNGHLLCAEAGEGEDSSCASPVFGGRSLHQHSTVYATISD